MAGVEMGWRRGWDFARTPSTHCKITIFLRPTVTVAIAVCNSHDRWRQELGNRAVPLRHKAIPMLVEDWYVVSQLPLDVRRGQLPRCPIGILHEVPSVAPMRELSYEQSTAQFVGRDALLSGRLDIAIEAAFHARIEPPHACATYEHPTSIKREPQVLAVVARRSLNTCLPSKRGSAGLPIVLS